MKKKAMQHWFSLTLVSIALCVLGMQDVQAKSDCCKKIKKELCKIERDLTACGRTIVIDSVPFTADRSGKYCVKNDLVFAGPGNAITITANNVTINFHNNSLTLNDPSAVGIYANGVSELTIENDIIQTPVVSTVITSAAIQLVGCTKVTLDNIFTLNTFYGVLIQGSSSDIFVTHSQFKDHVGGGGTTATSSWGIQANASNSIVIEESTFSGIGPTQGVNNTAGQILFNNGCTDCRVSNCQFSNCDLAVFLRVINGAIIENCTFQSALTAAFTLIQVGSGSGIANDIIIKNSTFVSNNTNSYASIVDVQGSGRLIEDCVFSIPNSPVGDAISVASTAVNTTIRNCVIQGSTASGGSNAIFLESVGTVIDNCQLVGGGAGSLGGNIFIGFGAVDCVVKNSEISGSLGNGIEIDGTSTNIALINNTVRDNAGAGIQVDNGAINTRVEGNKVFANLGGGIVNLTSTTPQIYFNTSCGNSPTDCVGFVPLSQTPGISPVVVGSNVCCTSSSAPITKADVKESVSNNKQLRML